jgi:hypothetical protein
MNVTLFGNKVSANVIKIKSLDGLVQYHWYCKREIFNVNTHKEE